MSTMELQTCADWPLAAPGDEKPEQPNPPSDDESDGPAPVKPEKEKEDEMPIKPQSQQEEDPVPSKPQSQQPDDVPLKPAQNNRSEGEDDAAPPRPHELQYSLRERKFKIARFWLLLLFDCCVLPVGLYYTLTFLTDLDEETVFAINTAIIGATLYIEFFLRGYHLFKPSSDCRVKGAPRAYFDHTHWVYGLAVGVVVVELVAGNLFDRPLVRVLAMPAPSFLCIMAADVLLRDLAHLLRLRAPFRVSNVPRGQPFRPGVYSLVEDIVAVDGGGGSAFRENLDARYTGSYMFRSMLLMVSLLWSMGGLAVALGTAALVWTLERDIAYGVGWAAPFIWATVWTMATLAWVPRCLDREYASWEQARAGV